MDKQDDLCSLENCWIFVVCFHLYVDSTSRSGHPIQRRAPVVLFVFPTCFAILLRVTTPLLTKICRHEEMPKYMPAEETGWLWLKLSPEQAF